MKHFVLLEQGPHYVLQDNGAKTKMFSTDVADKSNESIVLTPCSHVKKRTTVRDDTYKSIVLIPCSKSPKKYIESALFLYLMG